MGGAMLTANSPVPGPACVSRAHCRRRTACGLGWLGWVGWGAVLLPLASTRRPGVVGEHLSGAGWLTVWGLGGWVGVNERTGEPG